MRARLVSRADLAGPEREAMCDLLAAHFLGVTRASFAEDLERKNWALLLEEGGRLVGFSTLLVYETSVESEAMTVVYSGDTIVAPAAWGRSSLAQSWIGAVRSLRARYRRGRMYWLLISSGFRTYRFLPVFWREFYPRGDAPTPPAVQARLHALATGLFGPRYLPERGIVRLDSPQRLRGALAEVPNGRRTDPHVAFFLERNPGWPEGDELVGLTELAEDNLTRAGRRMWASAEPALAAT